MRSIEGTDRMVGNQKDAVVVFDFHAPELWQTCTLFNYCSNLSSNNCLILP